MEQQLNLVLAEDEITIASPFPCKRIFAFVKGYESLERAWSEKAAVSHTLSCKPASDSDRTEAIELLSTSLNSKDLFPLGSWITITKGCYTGQLGYVSDIGQDGFLDILTTRMPTSQSKSHLLTTDATPESDFSTSHSYATKNADSQASAASTLQLLQAYSIFAVKSANPTLNDILPFHYAGINVRSLSNSALTNKGDTVLILGGNFASAKAIVHSLSSNHANVFVQDSQAPHHEWNTRVSFADYQRIYSQGDFVQISAGPHSGHDGIIIDIEDNDALVVLHNFSSQVCSLPSHL